MLSVRNKAARMDCSAPPKHQPASPFLRMPLELRHEVLSLLLPAQVHVWVRAGNLHVSICHEPDKNERSTAFMFKSDRTPYDGYERQYTSGQYTSGQEPESDDTWARRLESSWGPHWMCEDHARAGHKLDLSILKVCKKLYVVQVFHRGTI